MRLPDGRALDVWQGGDPDGSPVLFLHGTPGGRLQGALGDGAAARVGVRLVSFSRPGYGGSTDAATTLASVARDAGQLADTLGIGSFAVLGVSGGGPYAVATGAVLPHRVRAVGVVAGVGPLLELDPGSAAGAAVRAAVAGDHDGAITLQDATVTATAAAAARRGAGARGFSSPEILEPWTPSGRPGLPSYRGASRDSLAFAVGWDIDLEAVTAPVWLWYGDHDQQVPLEHGRWLHERLPTSTLVVREGAGHLATLMPYWRDMLATLTRDRSG
ncbi:pimeloyl-ACP methyl ester carboxylesterase [Humibacillus xanthopallidus]|uniref:Pimeloyl-ACP methyl ester carboxylesterase n=1 Tax=Humibacillus xanthopallidus TaxID=412689 RepID=A0A543HW67_9MICO|nr:pimeloyl-ACP methyl ester carboxylesterase [Humibacillus xanthopallidus]